MARPQLSFVKSCGGLGDLPGDGRPEIALLGRSNVGKSSLLNCLAGDAALARTSRTPGRTRLLNYFTPTDEGFYLVDCPGYGYAKVSRSLREEWGGFIHPYLETRETLALCVLLIDANIPPQAMDLNLHDWLRRRDRPVQVVATKCDRLSGNQRPKALRSLEQAFGEAPLPFSSVTHAGRDTLWRQIVRDADRPTA